jgi:hypothetical protein
MDGDGGEADRDRPATRARDNLGEEGAERVRKRPGGGAFDQAEGAGLTFSAAMPGAAALTADGIPALTHRVVRAQAPKAEFLALD